MIQLYQGDQSISTMGGIMFCNLRQLMTGLGVLFILCFSVQGKAAVDYLGETEEIVYGTPSALSLKQKATALASPVKLFEYIRNHYQYALYDGSRSDSVNTFLGRRGNDVDLATTLIALYRSQGIPARYAVGSVRLDASRVANWLGVRSGQLAANLLQQMQSPKAPKVKWIPGPSGNQIEFEHVWVEVMVSYLDYRGAAPSAKSASCSIQSADCVWIGLDPSFKTMKYNEGALKIRDQVPFDYRAYYNAIKDGDARLLDKNPLEIQEEAILRYLHANHPGKTLDDVAYTGTIVRQELSVLPASLPFEVAGAVRTYASVTAHDLAEPTVSWSKYLEVTIYKQRTNGNPDKNHTLLSARFSLARLSSHRLTLRFPGCGQGCLSTQLLLDGTVAVERTVSLANGFPKGFLTVGDPFILDLAMDGKTSGDITTEYRDTVGGYYRLIAGGETFNRSQARRAAERLLTAGAQYPIGVTGSGKPYVDRNRNGRRDTGEKLLINHYPAMEALTGGLLDVAASTYYARMVEAIHRLDALHHLKTPIVGLMGMVSSVRTVDYVDGTAFSITPRGLLIDLRGNTVAQSMDIDSRAGTGTVQADRSYRLIVGTRDLAGTDGVRCGFDGQGDSKGAGDTGGCRGTAGTGQWNPTCGSGALSEIWIHTLRRTAVHAGQQQSNTGIRHPAGGVQAKGGRWSGTMGGRLTAPGDSSHPGA